jgi:hypothetical protein
MIIPTPAHHGYRGEIVMKAPKAAIPVSIAAVALASLPAATAHASGSRIIFTMHAVRSKVKFVKDTAPKGKINAGDGSGSRKSSTRTVNSRARTSSRSSTPPRP